ncbi:MAG: DUF488 domain-containing protein [Candidatus Hydrogenedentes bacterium]|nr:DUF488 domain-containing protein [Candidatus Hydrogenedentota bacterium]
MQANGYSVFTIGHSTHSAEKFLALLRLHDVGAVADVRSSPYSRHNPQFNREPLGRYLRANRIYYVFLGQELGARSDDPSCYEHGQVQYARLAQTALFQSGLDRVLEGAAQFRVALMCAEKEPLECHRTLLVAKALVARGQSVSHIHADGHLETHEAALERLLTLTGTPGEDMFRSREDLLAEAMARQERQIAYVAAPGKSPSAREETP